MERKSVCQTKRLTGSIEVSVWIGLLLLALACTEVWAQSTAQVSGTVKDQTNAVLPGAEVSVTQTETGLKRSAVTNETGSYVIPNLPVGPYRLEATLPGFRTYVQTGIVLQVNANPVVNAVLEVGQLADQVEVQADAALVETRTTGIGQVIDNIRVLEMPLNGRQVTELILLSGAAVAGGNQMTNRNYPTESISVAGGLNNGLTYLLDGGTHNDPFNGLNLPLPFPDALQEFKVETSAVSAQYGQHSAGAVNAITKSGTNNFHGDLFEFVRNGSLNARNPFFLKRDSLKRNQYGGTIGGPVVQNKLFFFFGFQGTKQRSEPGDAGWRLDNRHLTGVQCGQADHVEGSIRQQSDRSGAVCRSVSQRDEAAPSNIRSVRSSPVRPKDQPGRDRLHREGGLPMVPEALAICAV
jgi:carboxypeptidase family protein